MPDAKGEQYGKGRLREVIRECAARPAAEIAREEGEAEYNLEVLEDLFEAYYVEPQRDAQRKADLNKKLRSAGKKPIP
jgi:hypothetical protein